jgi:hypothetical protein
MIRIYRSTTYIDLQLYRRGNYASFFNIGDRPICHLNIDAGYDTQDFISNLAKSSCFPNLYHLEWGEYNENYMDDFTTHCTPFDRYIELFRSPVFRQLRSFVWRNPICTNSEIEELKKLKPDLQILVVRFSANYI